MAEVIPITLVSEFEMRGYDNVEGYPSVWWRDGEDKVRLWPQPIYDTTGKRPLVTVLYFANGDPAGFIVQ